MSNRSAWGDVYFWCEECGRKARTNVLGWLPEDWEVVTPNPKEPGRQIAFCPQHAKHEGQLSLLGGQDADAE